MLHPLFASALLASLKKRLLWDSAVTANLSLLPPLFLCLISLYPSSTLLLSTPQSSLPQLVSGHRLRSLVTPLFNVLPPRVRYTGCLALSVVAVGSHEREFLERMLDQGKNIGRYSGTVSSAVAPRFGWILEDLEPSYVHRLFVRVFLPFLIPCTLHSPFFLSLINTPVLNAASVQCPLSRRRHKFLQWC